MNRKNIYKISSLITLSLIGLACIIPTRCDTAEPVSIMEEKEIKKSNIKKINDNDYTYSLHLEGIAFNYDLVYEVPYAGQEKCKFLTCVQFKNFTIYEYETYFIIDCYLDYYIKAIDSLSINYVEVDNFSANTQYVSAVIDKDYEITSIEDIYQLKVSFYNLGFVSNEGMVDKYILCIPITTIYFSFTNSNGSSLNTIIYPSTINFASHLISNGFYFDTTFRNNYYFKFSDEMIDIKNIYDYASLISRSEGYIDGYNDGYFDGNSDGNSEGYNEGYESGNKEGYNKGYNKGLGDGEKTALNFKDIILNIITAPINFIKDCLNFEIFGFNIASIVFGILGVLIVAWVIKRFI